MGILEAIWKLRTFNAHPHIKISGAGVASTTSAHYMSSPKCQKQARGIAETFNIEIKKD